MLLPETATTEPCSPKCRQPRTVPHHGRTTLYGLHSGQQRAHHQADRPHRLVHGTCGKTVRTDEEQESQNLFTAFRKAGTGYEQELNKQVQETPYGVPYRPNIWGAGWDIQRFGFQHYFLTTAYPEIFESTGIQCPQLHSRMPPGLQPGFLRLGCRRTISHCGLRTEPRADWSYIPGGVISGTALIRPDFPELPRSRSSGNKLNMCWEEVHPTICSWYLQNSC